METVKKQRRQHEIWNLFLQERMCYQESGAELICSVFLIAKKGTCVEFQEN